MSARFRIFGAALAGAVTASSLRLSVAETLDDDETDFLTSVRYRKPRRAELASKVTVFHGTVAHSQTAERIEVLEDAYLGVQGGKVMFLQQGAAGQRAAARVGEGAERVELGKQIIIPGFIDTHAHAAQHSFAGTGYDLQLLEWLMKHVFPTEARFAGAYSHTPCPAPYRKRLHAAWSSVDARAAALYPSSLTRAFCLPARPFVPGLLQISASHPL